jgi:hypothetical protein
MQQATSGPRDCNAGRLTINKRILPVWVYNFYNAALNIHHLFAWNETTGHKGVNNIISAEHYYHTNFKTGAKRGQKWMDGCFG